MPKLVGFVMAMLTLNFFMLLPPHMTTSLVDSSYILVTNNDNLGHVAREYCVHLFHVHNSIIELVINTVEPSI